MLVGAMLLELRPAKRSWSQVSVQSWHVRWLKARPSNKQAHRPWCMALENILALTKSSQDLLPSAKYRHGAWRLMCPSGSACRRAVISLSHTRRRMDEPLFVTTAECNPSF